MSRFPCSDPPELDVAVLSAGQSRRLGHPKQHVCIAGKTLLQRSLQLALGFLESAGFQHKPILISGAFLQQDCQLVRNQFPVDAIDHHFNQNWQSGMSTSMACARDASRGNGILFILVDQYQLTTGDLMRLYTQWERTPEQPVAARYAQTAGPPVIWPTDLLKPRTTAMKAKHANQRPAANINKQLLISSCPILIDIEHAAIDLDDAHDLDVAEQYFARYQVDGNTQA